MKITETQAEALASKLDELSAALLDRGFEPAADPAALVKQARALAEKPSATTPPRGARQPLRRKARR